MLVTCGKPDALPSVCVLGTICVLSASGIGAVQVDYYRKGGNLSRRTAEYSIFVVPPARLGYSGAFYHIDELGEDGEE